jgi:hypothetical protein
MLALALAYEHGNTSDYNLLVSQADSRVEASFKPIGQYVRTVEESPTKIAIEDQLVMVQHPTKTLFYPKFSRSQTNGLHFHSFAVSANLLSFDGELLLTYQSSNYELSLIGVSAVVDFNCADSGVRANAMMYGSNERVPRKLFLATFQTNSPVFWVMALGIGLVLVVIAALAFKLLRKNERSSVFDSF